MDTSLEPLFCLPQTHHIHHTEKFQLLFKILFYSNFEFTLINFVQVLWKSAEM